MGTDPSQHRRDATDVPTRADESRANESQAVGSADPIADTTAPAVLEQMYAELRRLAGSLLRNERVDHTLQPTALVHEAYLKLADETGTRWRDPTQFRALAATAMRRILVDHARGHRAAKRGGANLERRRVELDELTDATPNHAAELLALDEALARLAELEPRQARVVELRFFGGLTLEEVATVLDVSRATVTNDWAVARAWLSRAMDEAGGS
ncbi:MAG: ECF-type sigma factor [Phycisphaerales bacterium]